MVREPQSMDELVYFTQRAIGKGNVRAWVYKGDCPKCKKAKMGKPTGPDGKAKIRAKEYVCPECGYTAEKNAYEETLQCEIKYTCPECGNTSEATVPYKRKKFQGMDAVVFQCGKCNAKIPITKKMKEKGESDDAGAGEP
jgi:ssDNA-binding Zn-finger/Zn-ribbon topoisomerase 1